MTPAQSNPDADPRPDPGRWTRTATTQARYDFHHPEHAPPSQRQFARDHGLPRSTLGHWLRHHRPTDPELEPALVAFLDSPAGYRFLRRLVAALHLVFHLTGPAGIRPLSRFLQLSQLDRFVASSFGAQQALAVRLEGLLVRYADEEKQRLAGAMPPQKITACLDENFHGPQPCLVAVEPRSNFLLLESYRPRRDGDTWTAALRQALAGLPVEVVQVTSDQAKGLLACARDGLRAQHTPDLFHVQRALSQATSLPLHRQVEAAQKEVDRARGHTQAQRQRQQDYQRGPRPPGRPPDFAGALRLAEAVERQAVANGERGRRRQEQARQAVRGLADDYHPFDAARGRPAPGEAAGGGGRGGAGGRPGGVEPGGPGQGAALAGAAGGQPGLVLGDGGRVGGGPGTDGGATAGVPGAAAGGAVLAAGSVAWSAAGALGQLAEAQRQEVARVATAAVALFVRASSCVEGRNGRLALHHHGQGPLREGRLRALTAVHNFVVERGDGTTAAERFFGSRPRPLFEWLLERMPELPRPAQRRPSVKNKATPAA